MCVCVYFLCVWSSWWEVDFSSFFCGGGGGGGGGGSSV